MLSSYRLWRVLTGTNMEAETFKYFPNSDYLYFDGYPNMNAALLNGVIDAYLGDEPALKSIHAEQPQIDYMRHLPGACRKGKRLPARALGQRIGPLAGGGNLHERARLRRAQERVAHVQHVAGHRSRGAWRTALGHGIGKIGRAKPSRLAGKLGMQRL